MYSTLSPNVKDVICFWVELNGASLLDEKLLHLFAFHCTDVSDEHLENASFPIEVMLLGIEIDVNLSIP